MTRDMWQSPEPSPDHYTPHLPSSQPWWSSHCVDSRLARISSLLSRASRLARISSLLSRVSGVGWWAARCHMSDMSHCDRPLSRNYVKCPDKNRDPEERERAEIHRPMEWVSQLVWVWQLLPSYNADIGMNICPSLFIILICAVLGQNPPSCESLVHCERGQLVTFSSSAIS